MPKEDTRLVRPLGFYTMYRANLLHDVYVGGGFEGGTT
jgi:hypothetical protein